MLNRQVFDRDIRTKLTILTIIGKTPSWFSAEKLAALTAIEKKTILKYCWELDADSQEFGEGLSFTISKSKGILLEIQDQQAFEKFKLFLLEDTLTIKLMKRLFFNQPCSLGLLENELFVSESTIRRKISQFKNVVAPHDISIMYKAKNYTLTGDETQIRMFALMAFWIIYRGSSWPFPMIDEAKVTHTIQGMLDYYGIQSSAINETDKRLLTYILTINVIRFHQGNKINWKPEWDVYKKTNQVLDANELFEDYLLSSEEIGFFNLLLQTFVKTFDFNEIGQRIIQAHEVEQTPAYQATQLFFQEFESFFAIPLDKKMKQTTFGFLIASHLFTDLFTNFGLGISGVDVSMEAKQNYPLLSRKVSRFIKHLADLSTLPLFQEEKQLHMRYILFFSAVNHLTAYEPVITMHFESDLPEYSEKLIRQTIHTLFSNWFNIRFSENSEEESDLVIVSSAMSGLQQLDFSDLEQVYVGSAVSPEDFMKLSRILKKINTEKLAEIDDPHFQSPY